jgi:hypothetical protein
MTMKPWVLFLIAAVAIFLLGGVSGYFVHTFPAPQVTNTTATVTPAPVIVLHPTTTEHSDSLKKIIDQSTWLLQWAATEGAQKDSLLGALRDSLNKLEVQLYDVDTIVHSKMTIRIQDPTWDNPEYVQEAPADQHLYAQFIGSPINQFNNINCETTPSMIILHIPGRIKTVTTPASTYSFWGMEQVGIGSAGGFAQSIGYGNFGIGILVTSFKETPTWLATYQWRF